MADNETVAQLRHVAYMSRRSNPPRCHPFTILSLILSGGLIFIGLTMTVISNWPGATSVGNNPLKIAGPVILCVGFICFIICVFIACFLNKREEKRWAYKINKYALSASKQMLNYSEERSKQETETTRLMASSHVYDSEPSRVVSQYNENLTNRQLNVPKDIGLDETDVPDPFRPTKKKKITESTESVSKIIDSFDADQQRDKESVSLLTTASGVMSTLVVTATELETPRTKKKKSKRTRTGGNQVEEYTTESRNVRTTTTTVTTATSEYVEEEKQQDDQYRLRLNIKSTPGTGVYIQHGKSGKESDI